MPNRHFDAPPMIASRLAACEARIQQKGLCGYLVTQRTDQHYLTGFDGEDGAALILPGRLILITDGRFKEEAAATGWAKAVFRNEPLHQAVAKLVRRHRLKRIGFQPEALSVHLYGELRKALRPARLVSMPPVARELRLVKDPGEVEAIERAIRVAESAFLAVRSRIRPGMTERELAARLHHEMLRRGASDASFPIIVAEGANAARPHAVPGDRRFAVGSPVLIDWGATVAGYRSDLTRVVFVRKIPPRFRQMYEAVLKAQVAAIHAIRPGARMCDVDAQARSLLKKAGMGTQFSHSTGHGLGLDIHEAPRLAAKIKDSLKPGMVVTVEPGVYFSGVGGVRIEDDVLVTQTGYRVLSRLTKSIDDMVV